MSPPQPNPKSSLKRNREENWSDEEKKTLLALVKVDISVIEDKSTETNTNKKKHLTWKEIAEKFHMMTGKNRPANKIIDQWKRMKGQAKKNIAAFEKSRRATGGGQNKVKVTDLDWAVRELVPHNFFHDRNPYDDDGSVNQYDMNTATQQSPSVLRDNEPSESQPQLTGEDIVSMDVWPPLTRERNADTCTTYYAGSQASPSLLRHIEPSVTVREYDLIETDGHHSPIIPFREVAETPRPRMQDGHHSPIIPFREVASTPRPRMQQTSVLPNREINFVSRNEEVIEDDSPPRNAPAPRTRLQRKRKFNEAEYHKMLIKKKEEEYNGKAKQRDELHKLELQQKQEIHELELKKRKIEIDILNLSKLKLQKELGVN